MISWDVPFEFYDPISFDAFHLTTASYADPDISQFNPRFNQLDGNIDRRSHEGIYRVLQRQRAAEFPILIMGLIMGTFGFYNGYFLWEKQPIQDQCHA